MVLVGRHGRLIGSLQYKKPPKMPNKLPKSGRKIRPRFRQKWHFQPKRPSKSNFPKPTMSIFIDQNPICSNGDPFREKSVPKTRNFAKFPSAEKIIEKAVGQNVKNRPPMAPNQFLDPSHRIAASFPLRFTPPNIQKTLPDSSFDHPGPRYITKFFR